MFDILYIGFWQGLKVRGMAMVFSETFNNILVTVYMILVSVYRILVYSRLGIISLLKRDMK